MRSGEWLGLIDEQIDFALDVIRLGLSAGYELIAHSSPPPLSGDVPACDGVIDPWISLHAHLGMAGTWRAGSHMRWTGRPIDRSAGEFGQNVPMLEDGTVLLYYDGPLKYLSPFGLEAEAGLTVEFPIDPSPGIFLSLGLLYTHDLTAAAYGDWRYRTLSVQTGLAWGR